MNPLPRVLRALLAGGLVATALTVPAAGPASAADQSVTVDLATTTGTVTRAGAGFLYGLNQDGTQPPDNLLSPLQVTSARGGGARLPGHGWIGDGYRAGTGYRTRINSALAQVRRLTTGQYNASYDLLVSDLWGADTEQPANTVYPCTNGDCTNWVSFIGQVVADVQASGLRVRYDIYNEPDGTGFFPPGVNTPQYFQMWDSAVRELRRLVPSAQITGPGVSGWNPNYLSTFLDHTKAAGTLPTTLDWHFSGTPYQDVQTARSLLSQRGITGIDLSMNEYLFPGDQHAGYQAWYLTQLAKSGISRASHAIWTDCCVGGTLDSTLVRDGSGALRPTGQWWVYKSYADVSGQLVAVNNNGGSTDAVAAKDQTARRVAVLLGDKTGNTGTTRVTINGLTSSPWLAGAGGIQVTLQRIPDQGPLDQPAVVSTQVVAAGTSSLQVPIPWTGAQDAYFITLTPASTGAVTTLDATATTPGANYFEYGANWGRTDGVADMYAGTANWSYTPGSTARIRFTGTQLILHAVRDQDQGRFTIQLDNAPAVTIDDYAPARNASGVVWTSPPVAAGQHTATIVVAQDKNPASTGHNIALDYIEVKP
ncbi:hypothetical protein [Kribbella albertanoniae]|uniref:hypothetical protein n=1 Tax=Kribbella albertanoniae TaxID=1266829 RepID=UPI00192DACAD|nr:hypothetical protein [Kribbella albertanoniae]